MRGGLHPVEDEGEEAPEGVLAGAPFLPLDHVADALARLEAIEGGGASGKSWVLRAVAVRLARAQVAEGAAAWLPLLLTLATIASIDDAIVSHEHAAALVKARDEDRLVLLLDGLDEVPRERRAAILEAVDTAAAAGAVVVLTSRPSAVNADVLAPRGFRFFAAMPLRPEAVTTALGGACVGCLFFFFFFGTFWPMMAISSVADRLTLTLVLKSHGLGRAMGRARTRTAASERAATRAGRAAARHLKK